MIFLGKRDQNQNNLLDIDDSNFDFQFNFELIDNIIDNVFNYTPEFEMLENKVIIIDFEDLEKNFINRGKQIFTNYLKIIQFI